MAPEAPEASTLARLSLVKYQLETARQQCGAPPPLDNLALNTMQDAVEAVLALCAETLNVSVAESQSGFDKVVGDVVAKLSNPQEWVGYKARLKTMNKARVNFKHHGNRAESGLIKAHMETAESACIALVSSVYNVDLNAVAITALVTNARVRGWLETSRSSRDFGENHQALGDLGAAFTTLVTDAQARGIKTLSVRPAQRIRASVLGPERDLYDLIESVHSMAALLRVYAIGVDPREYEFFRAHVPEVSFILRTDDREYFAGIMNGAELLDDATYDRLVKFIVDTSLQVDARRFSVPEPSYGGGMQIVRRVTDRIAPPDSR